MKKKENENDKIAPEDEKKPNEETKSEPEEDKKTVTEVSSEDPPKTEINEASEKEETKKDDGEKADVEVVEEEEESDDKEEKETKNETKDEAKSDDSEKNNEEPTEKNEMESCTEPKEEEVADKDETKPEDDGEDQDNDKDEASMVIDNPTNTPTPKKKKGEKMMGLDYADITSLSSGKRTRRSATRLSPEALDTPNKKEFFVPVGRGVKLEDIEDVKARIKATKRDDPVLKDAHSLLFTIRGRPKRNLIKTHILQFSGYLMPKSNDSKSDDDEGIDEKSETKMSVKAFKLTVNQLKELSTLFNIHTDATDKESLVDGLLDFLGAPDPSLTKGVKKKGIKDEPPSNNASAGRKRKKPNGKSKNTPRKRTTPKKEETNESSNSDEGDEMETDEPKTKAGTKMPTDSQLRKWVKAYVGCFNLDKATTKHAIETASDKFGVDLNTKKTKIKMLLADELS